MAKTAKDTPPKSAEAQNQPAATEQQRGESPNDGTGQDLKKQVQSVDLPEAAGTETATSTGKLDILLDMSVPVTVTVGQTEIPVRRLLQLGPGSILKFNKQVDEPVDLFLKDTKFADGDVVVVDGRFAVRIRQIVGAAANQDPSPKSGVLSPVQN